MKIVKDLYVFKRRLNDYVYLYSLQVTRNSIYREFDAHDFCLVAVLNRM